MYHCQTIEILKFNFAIIGYVVKTAFQGRTGLLAQKVLLSNLSLSNYHCQTIEAIGSLNTLLGYLCSKEIHLQN